MLFSFNKSYGIDIGSSSVKIAEIDKNLSNPVFYEKQYKRDENGIISKENIIEAINELLTDNSFTAKFFVLSIPRGNCISRKIDTPFKNYKQISQTINYEIEPHIPYPVSEIKFDFFVVTTNENNSQVNIVVTNNKNFEFYEDIIKQTKLKIKSITTSDIAEYNFIASSTKISEPTAFINFGAKNTNITISKDGKWDFSRSLNKGSDYITDIISKHSGISFLDADKIKKDISNDEYADIINNSLLELFNEIRHTLNSYILESKISNINNIVLSGEGSLQKDLKNKLEEYFDTSVKFLSDLTSLENANNYGAAIGCALESLNSNNLISINLYKKENANELSNKYQYAISGFLVALLLISTYSNLYLKNIDKEIKLKNLNNEIKNIFRETLPGLKATVNEKFQLKDAIEKEKKNLELYYSDLSLLKLSSMEIFKILSTIIDNDVKLILSDLSISDNKIIISGITDSFREVDQIKDKIKISNYFRQTIVDSLKTGNNGKIEFKIIINL